MADEIIVGTSILCINILIFYKRISYFKIMVNNTANKYMLKFSNIRANERCKLC